MKRLAVAMRTLLVGLLASVTLAAAPAGASPDRPGFSYDNPRYDDSATLAVEGTIEAIADTVHGTDELAYALHTSSGVLIPVPQSFGEDSPTGGRFDGELALTGDLAADLRSEGVQVSAGRVIDADSAAGETAVAVIAQQEQPVPVASATVTEPVVTAATPKAHRAYVAVLTNLGTLPSDADIVADVNAMTSFWDDEAGATITSFDHAPIVKYASTVADASCGLAGDNGIAVWNEAATKFPVVFSSSTTNHLMVLVPESCNQGGSVGIGTVGQTIGQGGRAIIKLGQGALQTGPHELGHNFGLGHANLETCSTSCSIRPYADIYSVMGFAVLGGSSRFTAPALDSPTRRFLDLADEVATLNLPGSTTTVLKSRADAAGVRGLRVVDPLGGADYFVDYRAGTGRDTSSFFASGDSLGLYRYGSGVVVTQYQPAAQTGQAFKALTRGDGSIYRASMATTDSYTNSTGSVKITVGAVDGSGAAVTVVRTGPVPAANPTFSHLPRVLQPVSAVTNGWASGTTFTYQWKVNGVAVAGATTDTYKPAIVDYNKNLSVTVTGSKPGYFKQTRTSLTTTQTTVYAGILGAGTPTISGTARVGSTLKVNPGAWTYGTRLTYRWYANNAPISGATSTTYKITSNRRGAVITVKVTGSKYPFLAATKTSAPTAKVR